MERCIDELADRARASVEPGAFFADVLRRAQQPGGASHVLLWRASADATWEIAGALPPTELTEDERAGCQEWLQRAADSDRPLIDSGSAQTRIVCPVRHAATTVGLLESLHPAGTSPSPMTLQFLAALAEISADFLSQQELAQLRQARTTWVQWDQFHLRLQQTLELDAVCDVIACDGRLLVGCDRVSVLIRRRSRYQLIALSGVERIDPRSPVVQKLEQFANRLPSEGDLPWQALVFPDSESHSDCDSPTDAACWGAVRIPSLGTGTGGWDSLLILENTAARVDWPQVRPRAIQLAQRSASSVQIALERRDVPWLKAWLRLRALRHRVRRLSVVAVIGIAVVAALVLIPAELTVSGTAELWPAVRRDVFAGSSGIVDQILVQHGATVSPEQPLIRLRDPELEQDRPRIAGDLATTRERLRGIQIARLTGIPRTPDSTMHLRQLTAEEEELRERMRSLERQNQLLEERRQQLTLKSPIAGQVLSWDIEQHLQGRPVERGQSLLSIGDTAGPWILEVQIADHDAGHLLQAREKSTSPLRVDFQLPSEPGRRFTGTVQTVSLATESSPDSTGYLRVVVAIDRDALSQLRPGAQAIPHVSCGRHPLGYVWLHDLIDALWIRLTL